MDWDSRAKEIKALNLQGDASFYNREVELQALLARLSARPQLVTMVIGPNNCGKSKLLKRLRSIWMSNEELAATSPVFYFDMRLQVWSTPQDAAAHIQEAPRSWAIDVFREWAERVKHGLAGVTITKHAAVDMALKLLLEFIQPVNQPKSSDLAKVMEALCAVIGKAQVWYPIFIFDEADRLKEWPKADLVTFFGFFKSMVKQDNRAYLLLSTSDDLFRKWLRDMFDTAQWQPFGVGDLTKEAAKSFFDGYSLPSAQGTPPPFVGASDWSCIYSVCGGSAPLLNRCALAAAQGISWKEAAEALMESSLHTVEMGLAAENATKGFSGEKYRLICSQIVLKRFVGVNAVLASVYNGDRAVCMAELLAMISGNFIHIRYVTAETQYGDVTKADAGKEVELVMARNPAHRAAMKEALGLEWPTAS